jgi:hypothetical protein
MTVMMVDVMTVNVKADTTVPFGVQNEKHSFSKNFQKT